MVDGFSALGRLFRARGVCVVGASEDPRFRSNQDRVRHREALVAILSDITRGRPTAEWLERLERAGIPCAPVLDLAQAFAEPQPAENDMVVALEYARKVLEQVAGLRADEIDRLAAEGVI